MGVQLTSWLSRRAGPQQPLALLCFCTVLVCTSWGALAQQQACPGLAAGACGPTCQQETCLALESFFKATHVDSPWNIEDGWELLNSQTCQQLLGSGSVPTYCEWHGLDCCTPAAFAQQQCAAVNAVISVTLPVNNLNGSISAEPLVDALVRLHACGLANLALEGNDLSGSLSSRLGELTQLTTLDLGSNWLTGTLPEEMGKLQALQRLDLNGNYFYGSLPAWLNTLQRLEVLNLGDSGDSNAKGTARGSLQGPLPAGLLRSPQLRELGLDGATLQGGIPDPLCGPNTSVRVLSIRNAGLTGRADGVLSCTALSMLDLSHNQLTGPVPASTNWSGLQVLRLQSNAFSEDLPAAMWQMPYLAVADISNNRITGTLSRDILVLTYLSAFLASSNRLSGTFPLEIFYSPGLMQVRLDNNLLTGTLPDSLLYATSLTELNVANNTRLTGTLPAQMGALPLLTTADFTNTSLSCDASSSINGTCTQLLPCFLTFASYEGPAQHNIVCQAITRKSAQAAAADCPPEMAQLLLTNPLARSDLRWQLNRSYYQYRTCQCLPDHVTQWNSNWTEMVCLPGDGSGGGGWWKALLVAVFSTFAVLVATYVLTRVLVGARYQPRWLRQQEMRRKRATGPPTSGMVSVVVTDIEGYSELMRYSPSLMTRALGLHNAVIRRASWTHGGHVIEQEGDSFTIAFHEPMDAVSFCLQAQQALMLVDWPAGLGGAHESAEGGSAGSAAGGSRTERRSGSKSDLGGGKFDFGGHRGDFGGSRADFGSAADLVALERMLNGGNTHKRVRSSVDLPARLQRAERMGSGGSSHGRGGSDGAMERPVLSGLEEDASVMDGSFTSHYHSSDDDDVHEQVGHQRSSRSLGSLARHPSATPSGGPARQLTHASSMAGRISSLLLGHLPGPLRGKSNSKMSVDRQPGVPGSGSSRNDSQHRFFSLFLRPVSAESEMLFYGLRVRMGVATGVLQEGTALKNSAALDLAKLVSDAGGGGQVLVEAATFESIRERLHELGAVDGRGVNERWLQAGRSLKLLLSPITAFFWRCKMFLIRGMEGTIDDEVLNVQQADHKSDDGADERAAAKHSAREAVVLDMGEYEVPGVDAAAATAIAASMFDRWSLKATLNPWQRFSTADNPFARGSMVGDMGQRRGSAGVTMRRQSLSNQPFRRRSAINTSADGGERGNAPLHLFSVLPPPLVGRAKVWGNTLALKDDTKQVDKAYFDAPGTLYAEVDRTAAAVQDADAIAVVTIVAVAIAGAKGYRRWRRDDEARLLAGMLADCLRQTLAAVPSGYLCREHDDGMRYFVAFPNPQAALQWCLATQEAMMYQPWPASILSFPGFEEITGNNGRLHFRGPRLKMGLAEGCPRSILPDHTGRAEYTGPCVIQALRLMECAAHGGQIVCDLELVHRVFRRWRHEDDYGVDNMNEQPSVQMPGTMDNLSPSSRRGSLEGQLEPAERANSLSPKAAAMPGWLSRVLPHHDHLHAAATADSTLQIRGTSNATTLQGTSISSHPSTELVHSSSAAAAAAAAIAATAAAAAVQGSPLDVASPFAAASMQASSSVPLTAEQLQCYRKPGRGKRPLYQGTAAELQQQQQGQQGLEGPLKVTSSAPARTVLALQQSASGDAANALASLPLSAAGGGSPPAQALSEEAQRRLALLFGKTVPASIQPAPSSFPQITVAVEATHLGAFRLRRGSHDTSDVIAVGLTRLKGRRFHFDFPKPHACIKVRDGVADGALCELPDVCAAARKEWEAQQRREEEQKRLVAAAIDRSDTLQQLKQSYGTTMLRRSMSVLGSRNRTNSMNVRMAVLDKQSEEVQRHDLEEARDQG